MPRDTPSPVKKVDPSRERAEDLPAGGARGLAVGACERVGLSRPAAGGTEHWLGHSGWTSTRRAQKRVGVSHCRQKEFAPADGTTPMVVSTESVWDEAVEDAYEGLAREYEAAVVYADREGETVLHEGPVRLLPSGWLEVPSGRLLSPEAVHHVDPAPAE